MKKLSLIFLLFISVAFSQLRVGLDVSRTSDISVKWMGMEAGEKGSPDGMGLTLGYEQTLLLGLIGVGAEYNLSTGGGDDHEEHDDVDDEVRRYLDDNGCFYEPDDDSDDDEHDDDQVLDVAQLFEVSGAAAACRHRFVDVAEQNEESDDADERGDAAEGLQRLDLFRALPRALLVTADRTCEALP